MSPEDRAPLGKNGLTNPEIEAKNNVTSEANLQREICQYLNLKYIYYINPPYGKPVRFMPEGSPDFQFVFCGLGIALECKVGKNQQSDAQKKIEEKMRKCGWKYFVITDFAQVLTILSACEKSLSTAEKLIEMHNRKIV